MSEPYRVETIIFELSLEDTILLWSLAVCAEEPFLVSKEYVMDLESRLP
jgi:hypothetical protein